MIVIWAFEEKKTHAHASDYLSIHHNNLVLLIVVSKIVKETCDCG